MNFIGRELEQKIIDSILKKKGYKGCLIYGRRRIGKTKLAKHCLMDKGVPFIIYQCKESSEKDNTYLLIKSIKHELNIKNIHHEYKKPNSNRSLIDISKGFTLRR